MRYHCSVSARLLAVMLSLAVLFLVGCGPKDSAPETTTAPTAAPTMAPNSTDPTDPPVQTAHGKMVAYLKANGPVKVEESGYTFTMSTEGGKILWEYKNDSTVVSVTLTDGAAMHPVKITYSAYDAWADVETATYSNAEHRLSNFRSGVPSLAEPMENLATAAVWACFIQAEEAMEPADVDLVDLGFVNYYG